MAGLRKFASHGGAVFYLGAGWPHWKPLDTPGTHLSFKRGSQLTECRAVQVLLRFQYFKFQNFQSLLPLCVCCVLSFAVIRNHDNVARGPPGEGSDGGLLKCSNDGDVQRPLLGLKFAI